MLSNTLRDSRRLSRPAPVTFTQRRGFLYTGDLTGTIYRVNSAG